MELEKMKDINFDVTTDISSFIFEHFPTLLTRKTETERYWKGLTHSLLEEAMEELQKDNQKHSLAECYTYIKNKKEEEKKKQSILSTIRTTCMN